MRGSRRWTTIRGGSLCTQTESRMDKELITVGESVGERSPFISAAVDLVGEGSVLKSYVFLRLAWALGFSPEWIGKCMLPADIQ